MPPNAEITKFAEFDLNDVQTVSQRPQRVIELVEPNPKWASSFVLIAQRIQAALGGRALAIEHVGSTSVPDLWAEDVIDVDLVVADPVDEEDYVRDLEEAGFQFLFREPWYEHRFFGLDEPYANIHVFGPACPEIVRHRIFKAWLRDHEEDRRAYEKEKKEAASAAREAIETTTHYNERKELIVREILERAFKENGFV